MMEKRYLHYLFSLSILLIFNACSKPLPWPESPLYDFSKYENEKANVLSIDSIKKQLVGHYAHYDVVSYKDTTTQSPMFTFVISYGFTDFYLDNEGNLMQSHKFLYASHKINQKNISSKFNEKAVQAIKPQDQKVEISMKDGKWHILRPPTPSLLGITGDPSKPLSRNRKDPNLNDPDGDGKPGVTVNISISNIIKGEIYITRREIFTHYLMLNNDRTLTGYVKDDSEQFVVGASLKILDQASNNSQHPAKGMNPVILVPISDDINTLEKLMKIRDDIFPKEPSFMSN